MSDAWRGLKNYSSKIVDEMLWIASDHDPGLSNDAAISIMKLALQSPGTSPFLYLLDRIVGIKSMTPLYFPNYSLMRRKEANGQLGWKVTPGASSEGYRATMLRFREAFYHQSYKIC